MLLYREKSGYGHSVGMIRYITSWDKIAMSRDAEIFFYPKGPGNIVDIGVGESPLDIEVFQYPHCRKDLLTFLTKRESEVRMLLDLALEKFPGRTLFTVDVEEMKILEDDDFTTYRASKERKYNLFSFQARNGTGTFPLVFVVSEQHEAGDYKYLLDTQVFTSHYCVKAARIHTLFGKNLTYILANSIERGKFIGSKIPNIGSINFPTNGREHPPVFIKTDAFEAFMEKCGVDTLKASGKEVILLPAPENQQDADTEALQNLQYVLSKDEVDNVKARALRIQTQVLQKNSISVQDLMAHGVKETLACIPVQNGIIHIDLDIGGIARKMCLYKEKVYVIPVNKKTEWDIYFGADPDFFVECTDETYPTGSI